MNQRIKRFNIRVYGLLIHQDKILITDEHRGGMLMTKFPGGGLEKGEGLADCLVREFQEEIAIDINVGDFFYVNEFLQVSRFNPEDQLMSFYYFVDTVDPDAIPVEESKIEIKPNEQVFRWVALSDLNEEMFNFPLDKIVSQKLKR